MSATTLDSLLSLYTVRLHDGRNGRTRIRNIMADTPKAAKEMVFAMPGESVTAKLADPLSTSFARLLLRKKASQKDLKAFYSNLYAAIRIDDSFTEALYYSLITIKGASLRNGILRTRNAMREVSPDQAFSNLKGVIPDEHLESLIAGYNSGAIIKVVEHLSASVEKQSKVMRKIISACIQPAIVIVMAVATSLAMSIMVIPKIVGTLVGFGGEIPLLTKLMVQFGTTVQAHPWEAGIIGLLPILLLTQSSKIIETKPVQFALQRLPGIGEIFFKASMGGALTTMGLLLESGVTTQEALVMVSKVGKHAAVRKFFSRLDTSLVQGRDFLESAAQYAGLLGKEGAGFIALLKMGRDKGDMGNIVSRLGAEYLDDVDVKTETIEKFINPLAMLIAGGVVLVVVLALILPMANLYTNIL